MAIFLPYHILCERFLSDILVSELIPDLETYHRKVIRDSETFLKKIMVIYFR